MTILFDARVPRKATPARRDFGHGLVEPPTRPKPVHDVEDEAWWSRESRRMAELRECARVGRFDPEFAETLANMGHRD